MTSKVMMKTREKIMEQDAIISVEEVIRSRVKELMETATNDLLKLLDEHETSFKHLIEDTGYDPDDGGYLLPKALLTAYFLFNKPFTPPSANGKKMLSKIKGYWLF